jgi:hypothetical protein
LWGNDGSVSNEDAPTCIRLLGQEVMLAMREIGKELGLEDPFETNAPVHLRYSTDLKCRKLQSRAGGRRGCCDPQQTANAHKACS